MKLIDFIICDDIREEKSGKKTIIGAYDEELIIHIGKEDVNIWPKQIRLSFYIRIKANKGDIVPKSFNFSLLHDGKPFLHAGGNIIAKDATSTDIMVKENIIGFMLVNDSIPIPGAGILSAKFRLLRDDKLIFEVVPEYTLSVIQKQFPLPS